MTATQRTFRMVCEEHEDYGSLGLIPEDAPSTFEPLTGMGIVHDIIEHVHGGPDMGSLHDEMKAFGVAHWGRGQGDYWRRTNPATRVPSAPENTHSEIVQFFGEWFHGIKDHWFEPCPWELVVGDDQTADYLLFSEDNEIALGLTSEGSEMISETMRLVRKFASEEGDDLFWRDENAPFAKRLAPHLDDIERWMQVGWAEAEERFSETNPWNLITAWIDLEKAIDAALKGSGHPTGEPAQGDVLIVTWTDATLDWSAQWEEPEYEFHNDEYNDTQELIRRARAAAERLRAYENLDDTAEAFSDELSALEDALDEME